MIFKHKNDEVSKKIKLDRAMIDGAKASIIKTKLVNEDRKDDINNIIENDIMLIGETTEEIEFLKKGEVSQVKELYQTKDAFIITSLTDPKTNTNISNDELDMGIIWVNKISGEVFTCVDNSIDNNIWVGQLGTKIIPMNLTIEGIESNGLVTHFNFDEMKGKNFKSTTNNVDGNSKNVCQTTIAVNGKSAYFKGNGEIKLSQPKLFELDDFTICYWVRPTTQWWNQNHLWKDQKNEFGIFQDTDLKLNLSYGNRDQGVLSLNTSSFSLDLNDWNHITIKRESGVVTFYKNKISDTSIIKSGDIVNTIGKSNNPLIIGTGNRGGFKGFIDDLYIFNRGLSIAEITKINEKFK
jgi:hypothetical protein